MSAGKVVIGKAADGSDVFGETLTFEPRAAEPWSDYALSDGRLLRVRTIVTGIVKTSQVNSMSEPVYVVSSQVIVTSVPLPTANKDN